MSPNGNEKTNWTSTDAPFMLVRMDFSLPWPEATFVAFDTETSGAWPVGEDIVEFGAVKWKAGQIVDELQLLIKPRKRMTDFIIGIHGITNEMVADAPSMSEVLPRILAFMENAVPMAHHAPFDMGFVAAATGKAGLPPPSTPALCTSLLGRSLITGTENHKLQTLVKFLGIDGGSAHRALDDAKSCLQVGLHCFSLAGPQATLEQLQSIQGKTLRWTDFQVYESQDPAIQAVLKAIEDSGIVEFVFDKANISRRARPMGIVRSPDGDFMQALCLRDRTAKRFYFSKMREVVALPADPTLP